MSITALGPALDLDGPLPVARSYSLLATPGVVVPPGDERWMNGVNIYGYPAGTPLSWEPCSSGTFRTKADVAVIDEEDDPQPTARFDSLAIYFPLACSTHGMRDPSAFADRVELVLERTLTVGVEDVLCNGNSFSTNPFFADTNMDPLAGGVAVSPIVGLCYLENAIAQRTGRAGMIHATPAVVAALSETLGDPPSELRTNNGTPVVSGAGYIGAHPVGELGPGNTTDWVFATGPVEVYIANETRTEIADSIDTSDDTIVFRAEKYILAEWDRSLQVGVLIDWSLA